MTNENESSPTGEGTSESSWVTREDTDTGVNVQLFHPWCVLLREYFVPRQNKRFD